MYLFLDWIGLEMRIQSELQVMSDTVGYIGFSVYF